MEKAETEGACGECGRTCISVGTQLADVRLPVRLLPFARLGEPETECCGEPEVTVRRLQGSCRGCEVVVTQTVRMRFPVAYGADAEAGETSVTCRLPPCGGVK